MNIENISPIFIILYILKHVMKCMSLKKEGKAYWRYFFFNLKNPFTPTSDVKLNQTTTKTMNGILTKNDILKTQLFR